jgi:ribosome-binding ATPase YchF (GTP1/OBG family)
VHVHEGGVDPVRDIEIIELELVLADLQTVETRQQKAKAAGSGGAKLAKAIQPFVVDAAQLDVAAYTALLGRAHQHVSAGPVLSGATDWTELECEQFLPRCGLLTLKPVCFVCNMDDADGDSALVNAVRTHVAKRSNASPVVPVFVALESEALNAFDDAADQAEMLSEAGAEFSLGPVVSNAYKLLGLTSYYTLGPEEARAWTIKRDVTTAPQAAAVIHTDFERGFISADVTKPEHYIAAQGSNKALKDRGQIEQKGRDYVVQSGDIMLFKFNV